MKRRFLRRNFFFGKALCLVYRESFSKGIIFQIFTEQKSLMKGWESPLEGKSCKLFLKVLYFLMNSQETLISWSFSSAFETILLIKLFFCSTHGSNESQCWWSCSTASLSECSSPVSTTNARKIAVKYCRLAMWPTFILALVELKIKFIRIPGEWKWEEEGAFLCKDIFSPRNFD
jgi:hypothetical protein